MKIQTDSHDQMRASGSGWDRAAKPPRMCVGPRALIRRVRALLRAGEQGSALVEFALLLPMMLLLTTGIMIFGIAMNNYIQLTNAVSMASRQLAISAGLTSDPCAVGYAALTAAAPALTSANINVTFTFASGTVSTSQTTCATGGYGGDLTSGSTVTVTATYPLNLSVYGKVFSQNNAVLSATSTELVQ